LTLLYSIQKEYKSKEASVTAVCVTGLVVKDTGADFTRIGQWALIQSGGLGIMTFSTIFLLMVGKQPSLTQDTVRQDTFAHSPTRNLHTLIVSVVLFTFAVELGGMYFPDRILISVAVGKKLIENLASHLTAQLEYFCILVYLVFGRRNTRVRTRYGASKRNAPQAAQGDL